MIYEMRTYPLKPGAVAEFEERFARRQPAREKHSKLGAFWHTEFGPLNQVVHVWPYEDLQHRQEVRDSKAKDEELQQFRPASGVIVGQESEVYIPAPFLRPLGGDPGLGQLLRDADLHVPARASCPSCWRVGRRPFPFEKNTHPWPPVCTPSWAV